MRRSSTRYGQSLKFLPTSPVRMQQGLSVFASF
jgi:hypothetical protein